MPKRTTVDVLVKFEGLNNASTEAAETRGSDMYQLQLDMSKAMSAVAKAKDWDASDAFTDAKDPRYLKLIEAYVRGIVDSDVGPVLGRLMHANDATPLGPNCGYVILNSNAELCIPCGRDCHMVDGKVVAYCPVYRVPKFLPHTFRPNGTRYAYHVKIKYTLVLVDASPIAQDDFA